MIANPEADVCGYAKTPEQDALLERSNAPTLRDLQTAAKKLFARLMEEPDPVWIEILRVDDADALPANDR